MKTIVGREMPSKPVTVFTREMQFHCLMLNINYYSNRDHCVNGSDIAVSISV